MKIHPLSFNLPDFDRNAAIIGKLPTHALPPGTSDLLSFWKESILQNDVLKQSCVYTESLPVEKENDGIGDYMLRYFDSLVKQPERQKMRTIIGIENLDTVDSHILINLIAEARNFNATVLLFIPEINKLSPDLEMALFGNVGLIIVGQLTNEDKALLQQPQHQYFGAFTESVINLPDEDYCVKRKMEPPVIYHGTQK